MWSGRFANAGFIALAPNLYQRVGAPTPGDMSTVMQKMFGLQDPQIVRDLEAAAAHIRGLQGANGKVGCVGFCMGGRTTLLFACSSNKVDAAVDCWGGFIMSATPDAASTPSRPTPVVDLVGGLNARCTSWSAPRTPIRRRRTRRSCVSGWIRRARARLQP